MDERRIIDKGIAGKVVIPMQFAGIGDVIFCQGIARRWINEGMSVIWPVLPQFVNGLNLAYPDIKFADYRTFNINWRNKTIHNVGNSTVYPLRWTDQIMRVPFSDCMKSKYMFMGMDWQIWKRHAVYKRDIGRELELLKIINPEGKRFNLIGRHFRSDNSGVVDIAVNNGFENIEIRNIPGFSVFDWSTAFETAEEIHTVSTSTLYILCLLNLPAHIYIRRPDENSHKNYVYICNDKMILHD